MALADRIGYVDPIAWVAMTGEHSVLMSRAFLSVLEEHGPSNVRGRYAMLYRGDTPVAAIAAQRVTVPLDRLGSPKNRPARVLTKQLGSVSQEILVCGNLLSWGAHGIACGSTASRDGVDASVMDGVAEALYRLRHSDRLLGACDFVMVKDITPGLEPAAAELAEFGYRRLETEPNMVLAIKPNWQSFDDYLGALTSSYRKNAKKIVRENEEAGVTLRRVGAADMDSDALHALYMQVHEHASVRLCTNQRTFIPALARAFRDDFRCTVAFRGGSPVGFVTTLKDRGTAMGYYVGFDRRINSEVPLYFRLLYAAVEDAISLRCERLSLGRTALEPKARLGAKPEPMSVYLRHRVPMLNLVVRAAVRGVHHDEAPVREPFKES